MDFSCYSNLLLDPNGNFAPVKFFQSFCEIACREQRRYPGIPARGLFTGRRFERAASETAEPVAAAAAQGPPSFYGNGPSSDLAIPSVKEEQLEAISDDEDEEDENDSHTDIPSNICTTPAPLESPIWKEESRSPVQHRLKLVLDLDNTLLHACARSKIGNCNIKLQHFLDHEGDPEMYKFVLPQILHQIYYVKLRPGLRRFLREVSAYCDLAIHTNATREYADVIVAILDPDRSLFRGRVAAREDETAKDHKKNMDRLFGIDDLDVRSLVILDDRKDVWDDTFHPNIIHCGMYDYLDSRKTALLEMYPQSGPEQYSSWNTTGAANAQLGDSGTDESSPFLDNPLLANNAASNTAAESDDDCEDDDLITSADANSDDGASTVVKTTQGVSPTIEALIDFDTQLDCLREIIVSVAKEFNECKNGPDAEEVSVARLLSTRRRQILRDVVVQTVGMYKSETSHPEHGWHDNGPMHRRRLVSLGARVVEASIPELTHILAMRATQTIDRVKKERGDEVKYVHALWLHACESSWSHVPEDWFQAAPLLKKYDFNPPKKPWVDHWKVSALASPAPFIRLQLAGATFSDSNIELDRELKTREHLVTGSYSNGAQIWSFSEHVLLKFDPIQSNRLALAFQSKPLTDTHTQRSSRTVSPPIATQETRRGVDDSAAFEWGPRRKRQRQETELPPPPQQQQQPSSYWDVGQTFSQGGFPRQQQQQRWRFQNNNDDSSAATDDDAPPDQAARPRFQRNDDYAMWGVPKSEFPKSEYPDSSTFRRGNLFSPPYNTHSMCFSNPKSKSSERASVVGP